MAQGYLIGYEINEKSCQISYYSEKETEPQTLDVETDNNQIPLIIGKLHDTWAYGKEANRLHKEKEGVTVIGFRQIAEYLADSKDDLAKRFCRSLLKWADFTAASPIPRA